MPPEVAQQPVWQAVLVRGPQAKENLCCLLEQSVQVDIGSQLNAAYQAVEAPLQASLGCSTAAGEDVPTGIPCVESTEHFPAASSAQDNISLCKMYNFSHDLLRTALRVRLQPFVSTHPQLLHELHGL